MTSDHSAVVPGFVQTVAQVIHILTCLINQLNRIAFGIGNQTVGTGDNSAQSETADTELVNQRRQIRGFGRSGSGTCQLAVIFRFKRGGPDYIIFFDQRDFFFQRRKLLVESITLFFVFLTSVRKRVASAMLSVIWLLPPAKSLTAVSYKTELSVVPRLFIRLMLSCALSALAFPAATSAST